MKGLCYEKWYIGLVAFALIGISGSVLADAGATNTWVPGLGGKGQWAGTASKATTLGYIEAIQLSNDGGWDEVRTWITNSAGTPLSKEYALKNLQFDETVPYSKIPYADAIPQIGTKLSLGCRKPFNLNGASVQHYVYWK